MKIQYITLLLILASCGTVHKTMQKTEVKQEVKSDSATHTETVITEQGDTNVPLLADTTSFNLIEEDTVEQVIETSEVKIIVGPKKAGKRLVTTIHKAMVIPVHFKKVTTIKSDTRVIKELKQSQEIKVTEKVKSGFPWWVWLILVVTVLVAAWHYWSKYKLP